MIVIIQAVLLSVSIHSIAMVILPLLQFTWLFVIPEYLPFVPADCSELRTHSILCFCGGRTFEDLNLLMLTIMVMSSSKAYL